MIDHLINQDWTPVDDADNHWYYSLATQNQSLQVQKIVNIVNQFLGMVLIHNAKLLERLAKMQDQPPERVHGMSNYGLNTIVLKKQTDESTSIGLHETVHMLEEALGFIPKGTDPGKADSGEELSNITAAEFVAETVAWYYMDKYIPNYNGIVHKMYLMGYAAKFNDIDAIGILTETKPRIEAVIKTVDRILEESES